MPHTSTEELTDLIREYFEAEARVKRWRWAKKNYPGGLTEEHKRHYRNAVNAMLWARRQIEIRVPGCPV